MKKHIAILLFMLFNSCFAFAEVKDFKFGILKLMPDGTYEMGVETTRIPMRYESSGFRFGVSFENPTADKIEWHEVVRLPKPTKMVSGDLSRSSNNTLTTVKLAGKNTHIVDHFWFDKGDPLGAHRLELYVNGVMKYAVDFDVVKAEINN